MRDFAPFPSASPGLASLALAGALAAAVFFQGFEIWAFCLSQIALLVWVAHVLWRRHDGFTLPRTMITLIVLLYWLWLAVTLSYTPVVYLSVFSFWWLGTLPLAFWLYTLSPERERLWPIVMVIIAILGLSLALHGLAQHFFWKLPPRSTFININSFGALLNLIALPIAAYLTLIFHRRAQSALSPRLGLTVIFGLLVFAAVLTQGRGVAIALLLGLLIVAAVAWRHAPKRVAVLPVVVAIGVYALANLAWEGGLINRYATVASALPTESSLAVRWLIWERTWEMIKDAPWWGIGLSMFTLLYPRYRHPEDSSAGFLVHNDYLQLWLEAGLPALILVIALLVVTLILFVRLLRAARGDAKRSIEAAGLFAGLFAVALHSLVDFNFYVLSILIIAGLYLGRLHELAESSLKFKHISLRPTRLLSRGGYHTVLILLLAFPALYFGSIWYAVYETERAIALSARGRLDKADEALIRAARAYPYADNIRMSHADLYRHVLTFTPKTQMEERRVIFDRAEEHLESALRLNEFRPLTYIVRAQLYRENPDLVGADWADRTDALYRRALEANPYFSVARVAYARYLLERGRHAQARALLEEGLKHFLIEQEETAPLFALTGRLRHEAGDRQGVAEMSERFERAMTFSGWRWTPAGEQTRPLERPTKPAAADRRPRAPPNGENR